MQKAIYPGSFDPITMGHLNIIQRSSLIFESVTVAVLKNPQKIPLFTVDERINMIKKSVEGIPNVEVESFSGLLVKFLEKKRASIIIKGLRAISDFDFEYQMALMNRKLNSNMETIFLMTEDKFAFLSSSKVKELYSLGGNATGLISDFVEDCLKEKFKTFDGYQKGQDVDFEH